MKNRNGSTMSLMGLVLLMLFTIPHMFCYSSGNLTQRAANAPIASVINRNHKRIDTYNPSALRPIGIPQFYSPPPRETDHHAELPLVMETIYLEEQNLIVNQLKPEPLVGFDDKIYLSIARLDYGDAESEFILALTNYNDPTELNIKEGFSMGFSSRDETLSALKTISVDMLEDVEGNFYCQNVQYTMVPEFLERVATLDFVKFWIEGENGKQEGLLSGTILSHLRSFVKEYVP